MVMIYKQMMLIIIMIKIRSSIINKLQIVKIRTIIIMNQEIIKFIYIINNKFTLIYIIINSINNKNNK
jgi:hypothetical protein